MSSFKPDLPYLFVPEITVETPLSVVENVHKTIWNYVLKNGYKPLNYYAGDCACCEYAIQIRKRINQPSPDMCDYCPAKWPKGIKCTDVGGLFYQYAYHDINTPELVNLAKQIRDVPFYTEEEYKNIILEAIKNEIYIETGKREDPECGQESVSDCCAGCEGGNIHCCEKCDQG